MNRCDCIAKDVYREKYFGKTPYESGMPTFFRENKSIRMEIFKRVVEMLEPGKKLEWIDWGRHKGAEYKALILEVVEE